MLTEKMHWSFVVSVIAIYGMSQGVGWAIFQVSSDYYWKDVQKIQPSEAQVYSGIISIPWIVKPIWGLFTDILPVAGYRRRPYFVLAGLLGVVSFLAISLCKHLHILFALIMFTVGSTGASISNVTIDACVAENSIILPSLAADMQSLCGLSSSLGKLVGFSISGILIHRIGSQGVLGLLSVTASMVILVGMIFREKRKCNFACSPVNQKLWEKSSVGMTVSLVLLALAFFMKILPVNLKSLAGSVATLANWFSSWAVTMTANLLLDWSSGGTFIIYTTVTAFTILFVGLWVPETKGKTLEEIQYSFRFSIP